MILKQIKTPTLLLALTALLSTGFLFNKHDEVKWMDWNKGYEKAGKKKRKVLLVDVYTDWCGWCKKMDRDTYTKKSVIKRIKKHFIPVKFNPEKQGTYVVDGEELNGRQLLKRLSKGASVGYPTTFFLDLDDNKVKKISGYQNADAFNELLDEVMDWSKE